MITMKPETVTVKNDDLKKCPVCAGKLKYQEEWNRLFDSYDQNTPQMQMIITRLLNENEPKYICEECGVKVLVS
jgi:transketolase